MNETQTKPRWWPAALLLAGAAAAFAVIWGWPESTRQTRFMRSVGVGLGFLVFALIWLLAFSRLRWKVRLTTLGAGVAIMALIPALFHIRGVSGDLIPIFEPRWTKAARLAAPSAVASPLTNAPVVTNASDFPQFGGPKRNGVIEGLELETNWAAHPPQLLWRQPVGPSWSGFAVRGGLAITQEQRDQQEMVICYELATGRLVWSHADEARYATTIAGEGPRGTPTLGEGRVYTLGGSGLLNCLELATGKELWSKDLLREFDGKLPDWGVAGSPLLYDGKVIVNAGGSNSRAVIAFDAETGKLIWASGDDGLDYSSPTVLELLGQKQIVTFNTAGLWSFDDDGKVLWKYPWRGGHPRISLPVAVGSNQLVASSGYGTGTELLELAKQEDGSIAPSRVWKSISIKSKFGMLHVIDGYIYGLDDGIMACSDLKNGQRKWKDGRFGHGQSLLVGNLIFMMAEDGSAILIEPNPEKLVELARFPIFSDKTWNPPCIAGEYLLVRNDKEAACFKLPVRRKGKNGLAQLFANSDPRN